MLRTVPSLVALACLLALQPHPATAQGRATNGAAVAKPVAVNINSASATDLETLPGVGAKTAARIIEYRQKNRPFKKVEELMNVRGIGEKNFLKLKAQITVASGRADHSQQ